jgi:Spy/CpxP family protein refolding chaperone
MKWTLAMVALLMTAAAVAQTPPAAPPGGEHNAAERMDRLATLLDLTDAQKPQVQAVLQEQRQKIKALFEQAKSQSPTSQ